MNRKNKFITNWDDVPVIFDLAYAAMLLGVTNDYLQKLAKRGEFPAFKIARAWRVDKEDFKEYLNKIKNKE